MYYGELVHTETDTNGIEYQLRIAPEDISVRGNAMSSGDDAEDKACEDEIIERLDRGDLWAWCSVTCTARYKGFEGTDHLGGCSYYDTAGFILPGGYWDDMKREARTQLVKRVEEGSKAYTELVEKGVI